MFEPTVFRHSPFDLMRRMGDVDWPRAAGWAPGAAGALAGGHAAGGHAAGGHAAGGAPALNVWQSAEAATVTALLPGVAADALEVSVKDDVLTIAGERAAPEAGENGVWHRRERAHGRFSRAVRLPFRVDPERVQAHLADGVAEIVAPRRREDMPRRIEVQPA